MHEFFAQVGFGTKTEAKENSAEWIKFKKGNHIMINSDAHLQKHSVVLVFPWSFLPSTHTFETPMTNVITAKDPNCWCKEECALKFLTLFLPHRAMEDLKSDGSHQK